ncbi:hypothetical protein HispidOSU_019082 [Sigmodon hispidus]
MWTALVLVWISSVPLSRSYIVSEEPFMTKMWPKAVKQRIPRDGGSKAGNKLTERTATVPLAPVTSTPGTWAASLNSTKVTPEMATRWTDRDTPTTRENTTDSVTSRTLAPPTSSVGQTLPITTAGLSSLSTPRAEVPSTNATVATVAPHTTTVAAETIHTSGLTKTLGPAKSTPINTSTVNPIPTSGAQTQGATIQVTTEQPVHSTAGTSTPSPSNATLEPTTSEPTTTHSVATTLEPTTTHSVATTLEPTTTHSVVTTSEPTTTHSVASLSSTVVTTTQLQTKEPAASEGPVPPPSPTPEVEATSLTTQPVPALPTRGTGGTPLTTDQVETKATAGTASAGPTPRSSRDPKVPTTDLCQLSTQGQYLVVTTEPLTSSLVNKKLLLVVLVLRVTLFIAVLVMFALQAYESYKKKDYTQVDYLINGMYADSEM